MFKLMKNLTKKDITKVIISLILIIFQVWLDLKLPDYMSEITILVQTSGSTINDILWQGFYMLLCAGGSLASSIIVGYLISTLAANFSKNVRKKVYDKVESFGMEEIKKFQTSSLITRTTNDINNTQMFLAMGLQLLIKAPITAGWAISKIVGKGVTWSIITGASVLILLTFVVILTIFVIPKFKIVQKLIDHINNIMREHLIGIRVIRAFNAEDYQEKRFDTANKDLTGTQLYTQRMMSFIAPIMYLTMNLLTLAIYFVGAKLINDAGMPDKITLFSNMIVFSSYAMQVIMSFLILSIIFIMYPRASVSASRINEVLDTKVNITNGSFNELTRLKGKVEFKNVSFKYPDGEDYVLKNISFVAQPGETIAFIGSTGSGKSTIVSLLLRFYDVTDGAIFIDDKNIKEYQLDTLYNKLGYVPQKAVIFSDSIKKNIEYGDNGLSEINEKELNEALEIAQAKEFVSQMENGVEEKLSRGGTNISGGQKQRISIARAIARKAEIYIFDDCFSALDYKTDYLLRHELSTKMKEATKFIVAQRIGTVQHANCIIVLDNGICVGQGTHKNLLKNCKVYQEIAYSQLSKEELENA